MATCKKCKLVLVTCSDCNGSGKKDVAGKKCIRCKGSGKLCPVHDGDHGN